ncbi:hypothetical protein D3C73_1268920 [compost metagenome]
MLYHVALLISQVHYEHPLLQSNLIRRQSYAGAQLIFCGNLGVLAVLQKLHHALQRLLILSLQGYLHGLRYSAQHGIALTHNIVHSNRIFRLKFCTRQQHSSTFMPYRLNLIFPFSLCASMD